MPPKIVEYLTSEEERYDKDILIWIKSNLLEKGNSKRRTQDSEKKMPSQIYRILW